MDNCITILLAKLNLVLAQFYGLEYSKEVNLLYIQILEESISTFDGCSEEWLKNECFSEFVN